MEREITWIGDQLHERFQRVWVAVSLAGLVAVSLWPERARIETAVMRLTGQMPIYAPEQTTAVLTQLDEYWQGRRQTFDIPINWSVLTSFQQTVLRAVAAIPYGQWLTYAEVAARIGQLQAVRAVGRANATNPMPIVIPCHRVLGKDGRLHGYAASGGLATKAWLLRLEGARLL